MRAPWIEGLVKNMVGSLGFEIRRSTSVQKSLARRVLEYYAVEAIFDVGANIGNYGERYRRMGFEGPIVSIEPVTRLYDRLEARASTDPCWHVEKCALGEHRGTATINVTAGHGGASSILEMTDHVVTHAPDQYVVGQEEVTVETLESMLNRYYPRGQRAFVKLDVQGYEHSVLVGAGSSLGRVAAMQIEMSLVENYDGETMWQEMMEFAYEKGFRAMHLHDGWRNEETLELYQIDVVFCRPERVSLDRL